MDFKKAIRDVPDFPKEGILFRDITTLLQDAEAFGSSVKQMLELFKNLGVHKVCGIESRGFIFGAPLAIQMGVGFVPVRKNGKLPWTKISQEYTLEYGTDKLEIHVDAVEKGEKVLIVDDLLATGGTAQAVAKMMEKMGAQVSGFVFLVELEFLNGRNLLKDYRVESLIKY